MDECSTIDVDSANPLAEQFVSQLDFAKGDGLLPVVVQDDISMQVLMLGYMNRDAVLQTLASKRVTFFSRSKNRLWVKGETSGHFLDLVNLSFDCDADALLARVKAHGPTCHCGTASCFKASTGSTMSDLDAVVLARQRQPNSDSYTSKLFDQGLARIAQKVGEEGVEAALAGVVGDDAQLIGEAADLLFHLTVLLRARGLSNHAIAQELNRRRQPQSESIKNGGS